MIACCIFGWLFVRIAAAGVGLAATGILIMRQMTQDANLAGLLESLASGKVRKIKTIAPGSILDRMQKVFNDNAEKSQRLGEQIRDLTLQIQLARRQKHSSEGIIYSIRDAVIVSDAGERVLTANEPAGRLLDFDYKTVELKPLDELVKNKQFIELIRQSCQSQTRHVRRELEIQCNGENIICDCTISCIYDDRGSICGIVAVMHDITREKEIAQAKNDFVSHVSHELKTPLASITAYAEMLADGEAQDEKTRTEFYGIIQSQAQRLNRLIEDILNISRIESGLVKVKKEILSTTLLIKDAVAMMKSYAAEKNITIEYDGDIVYDQTLADKDMISQVIINLLSNAVKYTPPSGHVTVRNEVDEAQRLVRVTVTDTGVGIPPEELPRLFEKFYRVAANNKMAKGTGLGLNLVKQIIEKVHNGRIFVQSEPGKGSTFGFELPLAAGVETTATV